MDFSVSLTLWENKKRPTILFRLVFVEKTRPDTECWSPDQRLDKISKHVQSHFSTTKRDGT